MAVTYGFYNSLDSDRQYNALQMSSIFDGLISDGVFMSIGTSMMVTATTGMVVSVGIGRAWFDHTWTLNDAALLLTVGAAESILDRIDTVVLEVDSSTEVRANSIKIIEGTPSSTPVAATLSDTEDLNQYPLAYIAVDAGVTEIVTADITNKVGTDDCPFVTSIIESIDVDTLLVQWEAEFDLWFDAMKDQLTTDAAGNLQDQIDDLEDVVDNLEFLPTPPTDGNIILGNGTAWISSPLPKMEYPIGMGGRISLTTGVPVPTSDVADATSLYWVPSGLNGGFCSLFDGTTWRQILLSQLTDTNAGFTTSRPHDIFIDWNGGAPVLDKVAWSSATARATALTKQDGRYVLTGNLDFNYIGTVYLDSGSKFQDTAVKGFVWNYFNRVDRVLKYFNTSIHTYGTGVYRLYNNTTANNQIEWITGVQEDSISIDWFFRALTMSGFIIRMKMYVDGAQLDTELFLSQYANTANLILGYTMSHTMRSLLGYHYYNTYEWSNGSSNSFEVLEVSILNRS